MLNLRKNMHCIDNSNPLELLTIFLKSIIISKLYLYRNEYEIKFYGIYLTMQPTAIAMVLPQYVLGTMSP